MRSLRSNWDDYFLEIATTVATRATCPRKHVGAVLVKDRVILSTGYNGSIRGTPHCSDVGCMMEDDHCVATIHAEINAVTQAARNGTSIDGAECYVTASPCWNCFKVLANAGIKRIVYQEFYRDDRIFKIAQDLGIAMVGPSSLGASIELTSANQAAVSSILSSSEEEVVKRGNSIAWQRSIGWLPDGYGSGGSSPSAITPTPSLTRSPTEEFSEEDQTRIRNFVQSLLKDPRIVSLEYRTLEEGNEGILDAGDPPFVDAVLALLSEAVIEAHAIAGPTDTTWQILWEAVAYLRKKGRVNGSAPARYAATELSEQLPPREAEFLFNKRGSNDTAES